MAHDAIGIMQELDARGGSATSIFREIYMAQWRERMGSNMELRGEPKASPSQTQGSTT